MGVPGDEMSEIKWETKVDPYTVSSVVLQNHEWGPALTYRRRYWLAFQLGWWIGPLLMAIFLPKQITFGQIKDEKFRWIVLEWN